jgi:hypothetical protein
MRPDPTDYKLWGLIFGGLFSPVTAVSIFTEGVGRLDRFVEDRWVLATVFVVVAWILHADAVVCGVRLSGNPAPEQAADYDDAPPSPPPNG